jgi:hypothetical protein
MDEVVVQDKRYMSRKFRLAVAVWSAGTVAWAYGFVTGTPVMTAEEWTTFSKWIVGLYLTGNVVDSYVDTQRGK